MAPLAKNALGPMFGILQCALTTTADPLEIVI
jgi:hypothetical protein